MIIDINKQTVLAHNLKTVNRLSLLKAYILNTCSNTAIVKQIIMLIIGLVLGCDTFDLKHDLHIV